MLKDFNAENTIVKLLFPAQRKYSPLHAPVQFRYISEESQKQEFQFKEYLDMGSNPLGCTLLELLKNTKMNEK